VSVSVTNAHAAADNKRFRLDYDPEWPVMDCRFP